MQLDDISNLIDDNDDNIPYFYIDYLDDNDNLIVDEPIEFLYYWEDEDYNLFRETW
jgi:hypothetical protein